MTAEQRVSALISALLREGVDARSIERAVATVRDSRLGESISDDNPLVRAFAFEQARLLELEQPVDIRRHFGGA